MKNKLRKLLAGLVLSATAILAVPTIVAAQSGFGTNAVSQFLKRVGNAILPISSNLTLGSSSNRWAAVYTDLLDSTSIAIGGAVSGNLSVSGNITANSYTATTTAGTNAINLTDDTYIRLQRTSNRGFIWSNNSVGTQMSYDSPTDLTKIVVGSSAVTLAAEGSSVDLVGVKFGPAASDNFLNLGSSGLRWKDGWFGGTVSSTNLVIDTSIFCVDGTNNRVGIGTCSPTQPLTIVGNTFLQTGNLFISGYPSYSIQSAANGAIKFGTDGASGWKFGAEAGDSVSPDTNNLIDLGTSALSWKDGFFAGNVSATTMRVGGTVAGQSNAIHAVLDSLPYTPLVLWNKNAAGFSGMEATNAAGVVKYFMGYDNANGNVRYNALDTTNYHRFMVNSVEKMVIGNSAVSTTVPLIVGSGGSAGKAMCWKADGKTLGYCSSVVDVAGACTCN